MKKNQLYKGDKIEYKFIMEKNIDIPCGIKDKFEKYEALLIKWQKAINLVSKNTLDDIYNRHILDSLQLVQYLPEDKSVKIIDLGSGAGFPSVVLAMYGYENVYAIESDERKCLFMEEVSRETNTKINIINKRIENVSKEDLRIDENEEIWITARALAKIDELVIMSKHLANKNTNYLFLKGKTVFDELKKAKEQFDFQPVLFDSMTNSEAKVVKIAF
jgi:16S rRNA (guanine527-N7)-methyltransferase